MKANKNIYFSMPLLRTLNTSTDSVCSEPGLIFSPSTHGCSAAAHLLGHTQHELLFRAIQQQKRRKKKKLQKKHGLAGARLRAALFNESRYHR